MTSMVWRIFHIKDRSPQLRQLYLISNQEQSGAKLVEALIMFQNKLALQRRLDQNEAQNKICKRKKNEKLRTSRMFEFRAKNKLKIRKNANKFIGKIY